MSNIEWTEKTANPTTGCDKISPGCKFCYAEVMSLRLRAMGQKKYANGFELTMHEDYLFEPFKWKKPQIVFVNSMSDLFHKDVTIDFIAKWYAVMFLNDKHTYQILTKRPERREEIFNTEEFYELLWKYCNQFHDKHIQHLESEMYFYDEIKSMFPFKNVWEGFSAENQEWYDKRFYTLADTKIKNVFISIEPQIGEISLHGKISDEWDHWSLIIKWVICGGGSGRDKRPFKKEWVELLQEQCESRDIPFFFKQWGQIANNPDKNDPTIKTDHPFHAKGGCQLNGKVYRAFPEFNTKSTELITG